MKSVHWKGAAFATALTVITGIPTAAQQPIPSRALTLPVVGTFHGGGDFKGTITINRFAQDGNEIVAIGFVSGVLSRGSRTLGTAVAGQMAWPVAVRSGGQLLTSGPAPSSSGFVRTAAWSPPARTSGRFMLVQAQSCPVLDVSLGPVSVNLLGFQVALSAVTLNLAGASGTPLGDLVCAVSSLLGNVAGLVNLLNSVLGLLTGLLGGLTGGLGGMAA
jgi:hypothetical protein